MDRGRRGCWMWEVLGGAILGLVRPPLLEPFGSQINKHIYIYIYIYNYIYLYMYQGRVGIASRSGRDRFKSGRFGSLRNVPNTCQGMLRSSFDSLKVRFCPQPPIASPEVGMPLPPPHPFSCQCELCQV